MVYYLPVMGISSRGYITRSRRWRQMASVFRWLYVRPRYTPSMSRKWRYFANILFFHWFNIQQTLIGIFMLSHAILIWCQENGGIFIPYNPYISRGIYPRTKYYTDNSSYTRVTPSGKKLYRKKVYFSIADWAVVSDNTWIDEYSITPLIYHLYSNPFLCYSWD